MKITAVLAMTKKRLIGRQNSLPWYIPEDLKHFQQITKGGVVIMGKNTYFSLPEDFRPLPGRRNIVFSKSIFFNGNVESVKDFFELKEKLKDETREIFLVGGAQLYDLFFENSWVDKVELTLIDEDFEGDIFVKEFRQNFEIISEKKFSKGTFITLIKK